MLVNYVTKRWIFSLDLAKALSLIVEVTFLLKLIEMVMQYTFYFDDLSNKCVKSLAALNEDVWLWHRRLEHANFDLISKLSNKGLIRGLPKLKPPKEVDSDKCM